MSSSAKRRPSRPPARGRWRYANHYATDAPTVRLGVLWFFGVLAAIVVPRVLGEGEPHLVGRAVVVALYSVVAWFAGREAARAWVADGQVADEVVASYGAAGISLAAGAGTALVGAMILVAVLLACMEAARNPAARRAPLPIAGLTAGCAVAPGLAAASMGAAYRVDIGAVVVLVLLVSIYETGDYLVGSGAANPVEGPIAGMVGVMVVTFSLSLLEPPPFDAASMWATGGLVAVLCPLGAVCASFVLPRPDAAARALRRLDVLIVAGPVFVAAAKGLGS